jgi:hypothetical protein
VASKKESTKGDVLLWTVNYKFVEGIIGCKNATLCSIFLMLQPPPSAATEKFVTLEIPMVIMVLVTEPPMIHPVNKYAERVAYICNNNKQTPYLRSLYNILKDNYFSFYGKQPKQTK